MAIVQIDDGTYQRLARAAAAQGRSVEALIGPLLDQLAAQASEGTAPPAGGWAAAFDQWMRDVRARAGRYPSGFVLDDSRESIYEGRGE
jgi:plasmid stability protein